MSGSSGMARVAASAVEAAGVTVLMGGLPILREITFDVPRGQLLAIMGGNGSGKTTLVRTLLGLQPFQRGSVRLLGTDVRRFRDWAKIGYVPQHGESVIRQATVAEVVASGRLSRRRPFMPASREDRRAVQRALERVGLADRARSRFSDLSGGQQQRALIARALTGDAELMVLDEPLAGVDVRTQASLAELIGELNAAGMTAIVVLHELGPFAGLLNRAVVLRDGRVMSDGTPPELRDRGHETPERAIPPLVTGVMAQDA